MNQQAGYGFDPLADMGKLEPTGFGNYFAEGFVGLLVCDVLMGKTSQQQGGSFQVVSEWRVLESNLPKYHPVGAKVSYVMDWKHGKVAATNLQGLVAALYGANPGDKGAVAAAVSPESTRAAIDGNNRMKGRVVGAQTSIGQYTRGSAQNPSHPITKIQFTPVGISAPGGAQDPALVQRAHQLLAMPVVTGEPVPQAARPAQPGFGGGAPLAGPPAGFVMPQGYQQPQAGPPALPFAPQGGPPAGMAPSLPWGGAPQGGIPAVPPVAAAAPALPAVPQPAWVVHPNNPAYEYLPGSTEAPRLRK